MTERLRGTVRAPEFPPGLEWLNVSAPLTLAALRGKLVLLDFWTSGCINCHHVLRALRPLEERFAGEVVVVGVHSGKFPAESNSFHLRRAVLRLDVRHPVVNDPDFLLWRAYAVRAWPTLVLISPEGRVIGMHSGEFDPAALGRLLQELVAGLAAEGKVDRTPLTLAPERLRQADEALAFPGKAVVDETATRLYVADTEHHRIAVYGIPDGRLRTAIGAGEPGLQDGPARQALFRSPQGVTLAGGALYVADTGNHAVRRVALSGEHRGQVTTLAGTGEQARPWPEEGPGRAARLNSPWDLLVHAGWIYIAMAGSHQLWRLELSGGRLELVAGDGREALLDGPRREARLAQPSGLAVDGGRLWFVDSESSSLRSLPLPEAGPDGAVVTHLGTGLFDFGDRDGRRAGARLQHPQGVAAAAGRVYIADTLNNKLRVFQVAERVVSTLAGSGEAGLHDGDGPEAAFWEPGGLCIAGRFLFVADTSNHAIRTVHLETGAVRTLPIRE
jgi:thiol-disulfide isomerase/thioredoxin